MGDFILWLGGVSAFIIVAGLFSAKKIKEKRKQYETIAPQLGYKINPARSVYIESPPPDLLEGFRRLPMGRYHTHNKSFSFILIKEEKGRNNYIFDFWERKHSSSRTKSVRFTTFLMNSTKCNVPKFAIWPKIKPHFLQYSQLEHIDVGIGEINRYHSLKGVDEEEIIKLFSQSRINDYFSKETGIYVEGSGNTIACYRMGEEIPPHALHIFSNKVNEIYSLFENSQ